MVNYCVKGLLDSSLSKELKSWKGQRDWKTWKGNSEWEKIHFEVESRTDKPLQKAALDDTSMHNADLSFMPFPGTVVMKMLHIMAESLGPALTFNMIDT